MPKSKRSSLLMIGGLLTATTIAMACGSSNNNNKNANSAANNAAPSAAASAAASSAAGSPAAKPSTAAGSPAAGGAASSPAAQASGAPPADAAPADQQKLTVRLAAEPEFLDPQQSEFEQDIAVEHLLFRGLFVFDKDQTVQPALATVVPSKDNGGISADGLTYTIKMKTGQKFSNGDPITAQTMEYTLKRELDPKVAGSYAGFYYDIVGGQAYSTALGTKDKPLTPTDAQLQTLQDAVGVKAIDDTTLQVKLVAPSGSLLDRLAIWGAYPADKAVITKFADKAYDAGNLVGNGPYILKEDAPKDHITLVANTAYTLTPKPIIQTLTMRFIDDSSQALNAYKNGELDETDVPGTSAAQVLADPTLSKQVQKFARQNTRGIEFNDTEKPFDNPKVRLAIAKAVDRDALAKVVFQGVVAPGATWLPPGLAGYDKANEDIQKYDPAAAKQLLSDAGYPNGANFPTFKMILTQSVTNQNLFDFLSKQLKDNLNITIQADIVDSKTRSQRYTNQQFDLYWGGWNGDYPNADDWTNDLWTTGGTTNKPGYSNKDFDACVAKAKVESDAKTQATDWSACDKIFLSDAALAVMEHDLLVQLFQPKVKGMVASGADSGWIGESLFESTYIAK
jgi:oligopeptide transport system substrate-binding protein